MDVSKKETEALALVWLQFFAGWCAPERHTRNQENRKLLPPESLEGNGPWREDVTYLLVGIIHRLTGRSRNRNDQYFMQHSKRFIDQASREGYASEVFHYWLRRHIYTFYRV